MTTTQTFSEAIAPLVPSRDAARGHYEQNAEFFRLVLGPAETYSAALWEGASTLLDAQEKKIDWFAGQIVRPGARVLDIGCGWGPVLRRVLEHHGASTAVGLTLARAQAERIGKDAIPGLDVRIEGWQDHEPQVPYDAIISIEMMEAVAKLGLSPAEKHRVYRAFFQRCHDWLKPGGCFGFQVIAYGTAGPENLDGLITSAIFPECDLPALAELAGAWSRLFEVRRVDNAREDYVRTIRQWLRNVRAERTEAVRLIGSQAKLLEFERYLRMSMVSFEVGGCDLLRVVLRRIDAPTFPATTPPPRHPTH
jgi:cyclopropane-fatty-acyl-phospholipid synthase